MSQAIADCGLRIAESGTGAGRRYGAFWRRGVESIKRAAKVAGTVLHGSAAGQSEGLGMIKNGKGPGRIISPSARDRWQSSVTRMSPVSVKAVLWGALNGDLVLVEELWELMQQTWPRLAVNDGKIRSAVSGVRLKVVPFKEDGEEPTPTALERAKFLKSSLRRWRQDPVTGANGLRACVYDATDALGKGLSLQEVLWELQGDGAILPVSTVWVHPRYYGYGPNGTELQIRPGGPGSAWVEIPRDQFLVAVHKTKSGSPLTYGWFRTLALWWCAATYGYDWFLRFTEQYGMPLRWATFDGNADPALQGQLADMLENLGIAGWGMFPAGTDIKLIESGKVGGVIPQQQLMDAADKVCDIRILGQTLTTDAGDSGTQALGTVHADVEAGIVQSGAEWVADLLSYQLVPTLIRLNFGDDAECPTLEPDLGVREDAVQSFKREVFKGFLADGTVNDILANLTDLKGLTRECGLPVNEEYVDPYVPVMTQDGRPVTGEVIKDGEGDIVGGVTERGAQAPAGGPGEDGGDNAESVMRKEGEPDGKEPAEDGTVQASSAMDALVNNVLEDLTGVQARWLGGVKPAFHRLAVLAQSSRVSDAEFAQALETAQKQMPELFSKMDTEALATSLEAAMGAAAANGAVAGAMKRNGAVARARGKRDARRSNPQSAMGTGGTR